MEIVNGYICMNCCDVDKARLGQDPHQTTNQIQKQIERHVDKLAPENFGPAVTLGGSLQSITLGQTPSSSATASSNPGAAGPQQASSSPNGATTSSSRLNILA
jgi:hypothetical protein